MSTNILPFGTATSVRAADLLAGVRDSVGPARENAARFPTGMQPLDDVLGGGFQPQDLVLITGRPGVGKTITALQWARSVAMRDLDAIYVCYEHSPEVLLARLLSLEIASEARPDQMHTVDQLAQRAQEAVFGAGTFDEILEDPLVARAVERLQSYARKLLLVQASGRATDIEAIDRIVSDFEHPVAVFVDYLQKVPTRPVLNDENERSTLLAESLKELAITRKAVVVAIAAADRAALYERRLRLRHMRGSSALAYEADVVVVLNDKAVAVSKSHLAFDPVRAEQFRQMLVYSIEKHRSGPSGLDMEFAKDFGHYRVIAQGSFLTEKLVDDVLYLD
jgi:replicative DNA helicase